MATPKTNTLIPYGPVLPDPASVADGSLFYKTSDDGGAQGLYLYGFVTDSNPNTFGTQVAQNWILADTPSTYVNSTGDTMTGSLTVPAYVKITQTTGFQRLVIGNNTGSGLNKPGIVEGLDGIVKIGTGNSWTGAGGSLGSFFSVETGLGTTGLKYLGQQVWHAGNDGAGSTLDADLLDGQHGSYYQSLANTTGILPTSRGGTGTASLPSAGVIPYAISSSAYGYTPVGAATSGSGTTQNWQVLASGGTGAPLWVNGTSLNVSHAATAGMATSASTATSAVTATTATNVPWTGITGLSTGVVSTTGGAFVGTHARPSIVYDFGTTGSASPLPAAFNNYSLTGFDAYSTSDLGAYRVGLTVKGSTTRAFQLSANWNFDEAAPSGALQYRVNDDTGNPAAWGALRTIWDQGNLTSLTQLANDGATPYLTSGSNVLWNEMPATYTSATSFTVSGDKRAEFSVGNRVRVQVSTGFLYGTVASSVYTTSTLVTLNMDGTALDASVSKAGWSFLTSTSRGVDAAGVSYFDSMSYTTTNTAGKKIKDLETMIDSLAQQVAALSQQAASAVPPGTVVYSSGVDWQEFRDSFTGTTDGFAAMPGSVMTKYSFNVGATIEGVSLNTVSITGGATGTDNTINKTFSPIAVSAIKFYFRINAFAPGDAPILYLRNSVTNTEQFAFTPTRIASVDPARRAAVWWGPGLVGTYVGSTALDINDWYKVDVYQWQGRARFQIAKAGGAPLLDFDIGAWTSMSQMVSEIRFANSGSPTAVTGYASYADVRVIQTRPAVPPAGWLICDGSAVSRSTYPGLFAAINEMYGKGDGVTTFNLPDYRGAFFRAYGSGVVQDPEVYRAFGSYQTADIGKHKHLTGAPYDCGPSAPFGASAAWPGQPRISTFCDSNGNTPWLQWTSDYGGPDDPYGSENRPANYALTAMIKA